MYMCHLGVKSGIRLSKSSANRATLAADEFKLDWQTIACNLLAVIKMLG